LTAINVAVYYPGGMTCFGEGRIQRNTVVSNFNQSLLVDGAAGILAMGGPDLVISNNLVAHNTGHGGRGIGIVCAPCRLECNDAWGSDASDFQLWESDTTGMRNFSADPLFCGPSSGDYTIGRGSPCAPDNPRGCGRIGARSVACGITSSVRATWGRVKARYR
jgi:hypothetical protein